MLIAIGDVTALREIFADN